MTHEDRDNLIVRQIFVPAPVSLDLESPVEGEPMQMEGLSWDGTRYYRPNFCSTLGIQTLLPIEAPPRLEHVDIIARFLYLSDSFETKTPDLRSEQIKVLKPDIKILRRHDLLPEKNLPFYSTGFQNGEKTIMRKFFRAIASLLRADCKHGTIDNTLLVRFLASKEKKS